MHRTSISRETFLALSINRPAGAKQVTSYWLLNFSKLVSLISQGVWASQDVWEISAEPTEDTNNSLLFHIVRGLSRSFFIDFFIDRIVSPCFFLAAGRDCHSFFHILLETDGHKW